MSSKNLIKYFLFFKKNIKKFKIFFKNNRNILDISYNICQIFSQTPNSKLFIKNGKKIFKTQVY